MALQTQSSATSLLSSKTDLNGGGETFEKCSNNGVTRSRYTLGDALPSNLAGLSIMSPAAASGSTVQDQNTSTSNNTKAGAAANITKTSTNNQSPTKQKINKHVASSFSQSSQDRTTSVDLGTYTIKPLVSEYHQAALQHLRKYFFRDEPLNVDMGLLTGAEDRCVELEDYALSSMQKGVSLMAVNERDELIGVVINSVMDREEASSVADPSLECANPKFAKILRLLHYVGQEADVFGQFPDVRRVLSIAILSVDGEWRGKGIARALTDATAEYAKEHEVDMLRVDCTSHFTALISERLGFHSIYRLPYADYRPDGAAQPVFKPPPPHLEIKVFVHRVEEEENNV